MTDAPLHPAGTPASSLSYRAGILTALLGGICLSTSGLYIRAIETADAWQVLFYRSLALTVFLGAVVAWRSRGRLWHEIAATGSSGVLAACGLVVAFFGGIYAMQNASIANAVFLFAVSPLFAAVIGWMLLGERVRRATWIAIVIAAAGIALMVARGLTLGHGAGNAAGLVAGFGFGVFAVALRRGKLADMLPAALLAGILATLLAALVCLTVGDGLALPGDDIGWSMAMGVFALGAALILFTVGSKVISAADIALLSLLEVVLAPVWVWLVIGEVADGNVLLGGAIVLAALAGNALSGMRSKPPALPHG